MPRKHDSYCPSLVKPCLFCHATSGSGIENPEDSASHPSLLRREAIGLSYLLIYPWHGAIFGRDMATSGSKNQRLFIQMSTYTYVLIGITEGSKGSWGGGGAPLRVRNLLCGAAAIEPVAFSPERILRGQLPRSPKFWPTAEFRKPRQWALL